MSEYVLGRHAEELTRLRFQQEVWGHVSLAFIDRTLGEGPAAHGKRCLDVGCGPGLMSLELARRVGPEGEVHAVDAAGHWLSVLRAEAEKAGLANVSTEEVDLARASFPAGQYDFIFARWVLSFLPSAGELIQELARSLKPGGVLAIEDYNHEGVSLFPPSRGFEAVVRATRELYAAEGGDPWIAGSLPAMLRAAGLKIIDELPNVLSGGPDSPAFRWADAFFPAHVDGMVARGLLEEQERELFLSDWSERRADPDARFYSPFVVDIAATL